MGASREDLREDTAMTSDEAPVSYPDLGPQPVSEVHVFTVPTVPTAVVRAQGVPMATIEELFDAVFGRAFPVAFEQGMIPAGAAFALYTRIGDEPEGVADLEIGFPVAEPLVRPIEAGEWEVMPSELPSGEVAVVSHVGGYDGLGTAWGEFMSEIRGSGREPETPFWECYVTEPTPDTNPATLRTDLYCPVGKRTDAA